VKIQAPASGFLLNELVANWLRSIGLKVAFSPDPLEGFLPNVLISDGGLVYDASCHVSDLLHDAGHLAIIPACVRGMIQGQNVDEWIPAIVERFPFPDRHPDHPFSRALLNADDCAVTAWAWAAGRHLGLSDVEILHHGYQDDVESVRAMLTANAYCGIHSLAHAGFCATSARHPTLPKYPQLRMWLQDACPESEPAASTPLLAGRMAQDTRRDQRSA